MEIKKTKFAIFILTFGRPEKVTTKKTLRTCGYTGEIYLVCSTDDKSIKQYQNLHENVNVFDKNDYENKFDICDNFDKKNVVVYARNACFDIAKKLGYTYFIVLDDDYTSFRYAVGKDFAYITKNTLIRNLDTIFELYMEYYKSLPERVKTLAFAQGGDFIGGSASNVWKNQLNRKAMNAFFLSTERRFDFIGRINEDVNTYVEGGARGEIYFTPAWIRLEQQSTQLNSGGLSEFYLDTGTYLKSFYTVMAAPSCTSIRLMGCSNMRLHHNINWNAATALILNEKYKKK